MKSNHLKDLHEIKSDLTEIVDRTVEGHPVNRADIFDIYVKVLHRLEEAQRLEDQSSGTAPVISEVA